QKDTFSVKGEILIGAPTLHCLHPIGIPHEIQDLTVVEQDSRVLFDGRAETDLGSSGLVSGATQNALTSRALGIRMRKMANRKAIGVEPLRLPMREQLFAGRT